MLFFAHMIKSSAQLVLRAKFFICLILLKNFLNLPTVENALRTHNSTT